MSSSPQFKIGSSVRVVLVLLMIRDFHAMSACIDVIKVHCGAALGVVPNVGVNSIKELIEGRVILPWDGGQSAC